jgi:hypothetical protein
MQMIDTSIVRMHQHAACIAHNMKQSMGRSRGGVTSKTHAVVDANGRPIRLTFTAGEAHDHRLAGKLLSRLKAGAMLLGDRGYDADWIRTLVQMRGAVAAFWARTGIMWISAVAGCKDRPAIEDPSETSLRRIRA